MSNIEARLRELGIVLPLPPKAIGNFVYGVVTPGLLTLSGTYGTPAWVRCALLRRYFRSVHNAPTGWNLLERVLVEGAVPWSLLCSTQFHGYLSRMFAAMSSWRLLPLPRALLAPVATIEVAEALCDIAVGEPMRGRRLMAGPKNADLRDLARIWLEATGRNALGLAIRLPGGLGAALREGVLAGTDVDLRGAVTFAEELGASGRP
jgi:hypothetical protein